ncbi:uncharacterized protein LOC116428828 isoform X2 [Nomia melanderi]|uniref:uncharacterized protein LOC116428828 isoform X2 n=1 Tax=Nomia melanderi TaxID=2448451 RepID=UPI0013040E7D|nr:ribosomal RNA-processing protein 8 isoform X2 [Nomia melanderi]
MVKKVKKYTSNKKSGGKTLDKENFLKKKKQKDKNENKYKSVVVKQQNVKFKSKLKRKPQRLKKKLKKLHEDKSIKTSNLLNSNIATITNITNVKDRKIQSQSKNERKEEEFGKTGKSKQHKYNGNQNTKQSNGKVNSIKRSAKQLKQSLLPNVKKIKNCKQKKIVNNKIAKINSLVQKEKKQKKKSIPSTQENDKTQMGLRHCNLDIKKLEEMLTVKQKQTKRKKANTEIIPLRERMMSKLKASRFRYLNETMYNSESIESKKYFKDDPDAFKAYHEGYKQQVAQWPLNPIDIIISSIKKMPKDYIIADFGCGEAKLSASVAHKVHSFDFVSLNKNVTICDMAHTPLLTNGVHVVVFCLSLMGTNLQDYIIEANRILKKDIRHKIYERADIKRMSYMKYYNHLNKTK